jgi:hypothetical protein
MELKTWRPYTSAAVAPPATTALTIGRDSKCGWGSSEAAAAATRAAAFKIGEDSNRKGNKATLQQLWHRSAEGTPKPDGVAGGCGIGKLAGSTPPVESTVELQQLPHRVVEGAPEPDGPALRHQDTKKMFDTRILA